MSILSDSHEAVIAHRAAAAVSAGTAQRRAAAASARAWIDSFSARAHQRSIRRNQHHRTPAAAGGGLLMRVATHCSAAALTALAIAAVAPAPAGAGPNLIGAGDRLDYITPGGTGQFCTIGYAYSGADRHTYAVTAGHCRNSTTGYARDTRAQTTGQFVRSVVEPRHHGGADYGLVDFGRNALPSAFINGTPIAVGHPQPRIGQRVCHLGVSSGRQCGTVTGVQGIDQYLTSGMPASIAGDSGGPVWTTATNGYAQIIGIWLGEKETRSGQHYGRFVSLASGLTALDPSYSG